MPKKSSSSTTTTVRTVKSKRRARAANPRNRLLPIRRLRPSMRTVRAPTPNLIAAAANSYVATLNDPFTHQGVKMGFGCLVPSTVGMAYVRQSVSTNADGTLGLFAYPTLGNGSVKTLYVNNSGAAGNTWTGTAAYNASGLSTIYSQARFVSMGIKAIPLVAGTASPGIAYAGACPACSVAGMSTLTPNSISGSPFAKMGTGTGGAVALARPQDLYAYQFTTIGVSLSDSSLTAPTSVPFICFTGLPASTTVLVEVVLNFEGITSMTTSLPMPAGAGEGNTEPSLITRAFASVEQLWNWVQPRLSDPGTVKSLHAITAHLQSARSARAAYFDNIESTPTIEVIN